MTKAEGKEDSDQACREDTYQKRTHIRFLKEWPFDLVSLATYTKEHLPCRSGFVTVFSSRFYQGMKGCVMYE